MTQNKVCEILSTDCLTEFRVKFYTKDIPIVDELGNKRQMLTSQWLIIIYHSASSLINNRSLVLQNSTHNICDRVNTLYGSPIATVNVNSSYILVRT